MFSRQKLVVAADEDDLARKGAEFFSRAIRKSMGDRDRFSIALSGGTTPRPMYRRFSRSPYLSVIPWQDVHVFWVDERMVPFEHPDSNYGAARDDFLARVPIPPRHLHAMPVQVRPHEGARQYEAELKAFFKDADRGPLFDLVYLGVGKDGHTASLFPDLEVAGESSAWVLNVTGGHPRLPRLTLTPMALNRAKRIIFMISGHDKARILKTLWEKSEASLPALKIRPSNGELVWLVDRAAASLLPEAVKDGEFCWDGMP